MRLFEKPVLGEVEFASLGHVIWLPFMDLVGVKSSKGIAKEDLAAYMYFLKRQGDGNPISKIMRNFEQTKKLKINIMWRFKINNIRLH